VNLIKRKNLYYSTGAYPSKGNKIAVQPLYNGKTTIEP